MYEMQADIEQLQKLLDRSIDSAGTFLKSSFEMPGKSLSARQIIKHLNKKITVSLATVSKKNEPRVAPIGAIFYRGHFCIPTTMRAARTRMILANASISMTYYEGIDLAMIGHGTGELIPEEHVAFGAMDKQHQDIFGNSVTAWSAKGIYIRIIPHVLFTYARYIEQFN